MDMKNTIVWKINTFGKPKTEEFDTSLFELFYDCFLKDGRYKLTRANYEFCFANFLLGKGIYGPGKYIFGVFDNSDIDTKYKVIYDD